MTEHEDELQVGARILVVDDQLGHLYLRILLEAGYARVEAVCASHEALLRLGRCAYDLVVMDITLGLHDPVRDGCGLGQHILQRWPATRLLFVSGYAREDLPATCPADVPLLVKGTHPQEFKARVAEALMLPAYAWPKTA